ncbi:hypothetical protein Tco_0470840 [Tanacetum coccineum]
MVVARCFVHLKELKVLANSTKLPEQILVYFDRETQRRTSSDPQITKHEVFSTWMAFGGNTHDLGSFGEETDEITDLHQILEEVLLTERGDDVAGIKRSCRDPSSDSVRT